jgi:hypothetical protein
MLIYVTDAADLKLCLLLHLFFADEGLNPVAEGQALEFEILQVGALKKETAKNVTWR